MARKRTLETDRSSVGPRRNTTGLRRRRWVALAVLPLTGICCRSEGGEASTDGVASTGTASEITYWDDVAPLFYQRCVSCHQAGGVAPFALDGYETAKTWGGVAAARVAERSMPPWGLTADGSCGTFVDSQWLTQAEIDLVSAWVDGGLVAGVEREIERPAVSSLDEGIDLSTPAFRPEIQGGALAQFDEYRCFLVQPEMSDGFITAFDGRPGNAALIHHMIAMPVELGLVVTPVGDTNADVIAALDAESPERDGWACYGRAGEGVVPTGTPATWAPGKGVVEFPAGTGIRVTANDAFILQVHYNLADPALIGVSDTSTIRVRVDPSVEREAFMLAIDPLLESTDQEVPDTLEHGLASVKYDWEFSFADALGPLPSVDLMGIFPHMHSYGRKFDMTLERDSGASVCGAHMERWDFDWQQLYFYDAPLSITSDATMKVTCDYDTTTATEPVTAGWGTVNEMCLAELYIALPPGVPAPRPTSPPQLPNEPSDCCTATGQPGCTDPVIEACICAEDRFCCEDYWDEVCVGEVAEFRCGICR